MAVVKICGLKTQEDVGLMNEYLPEYVGFVFASSKRQVNDEQAKRMKEQLNPRIQTVGVFVNEPQEHIVSLCKQGILDVVQLHGEENNQYIKELREKCKKPIIKVIKVQNVGQVKREMQADADFLLFDTYKKESYGGSGECFELDVLKQALEEEAVDKPFFIAGGLTVENVGRVLQEVPCFAVDVSSGVEKDNKKDEAKVQKFIRKVREKIDRHHKKGMITVGQKKGRYGLYGGQYIPETLIPAVNEVEAAYEYYKNEPKFQEELHDLLTKYAGRPSLLYYAEKMTKDLGGAKIYLKREDLNHTGSHKINNVLGQVLLAKKMGKSQPTVANKLRLLHIPEKVRKEISVDVITERHVRSLLKLKNETLQLEALNRIYKGNLNVRQTDDLVEQMLIAEEKNIREQKKKKMVKAIKDMRIFVNTIKGTVKTIQDAGMPAEVIESETDEYMEVVIRLPKNDLNEQQNIAR